MSPFIRIFHKSKTTSFYYLLNARHLHLLSHLNSPGKFDILSVWLIGKLWLRGKDFLSSNSWKETKASLYLFTMQCPFSNVHYCWLKKWESRQTFMILPQFRFLALFSSHTLFLAPFHHPSAPVPSLPHMHPDIQTMCFYAGFSLCLFDTLHCIYHSITASDTGLDLTPARIPFPISHVSFPLFLKNFNSIANTRKALMYHN